MSADYVNNKIESINLKGKINGIRAQIQSPIESFSPKGNSNDSPSCQSSPAGFEKIQKKKSQFFYEHGSVEVVNSDDNGAED